MLIFFFSSRRRHTRCSRDWSSDVCSSDLTKGLPLLARRNPTLYHEDLSPGVGRFWPMSGCLPTALPQALEHVIRSEERRVGKECRYRKFSDNYNKTPWVPDHHEVNSDRLD